MITETLVRQTAEVTGQTHAQTKATLMAAFNCLRAALADGEVIKLPEFGTFEACNVSEDERNSQAGVPVNDDVKVVKFSPSFILFADD